MRKALLEEARRRHLKVRGKSNVEIERLLRTENNSQKTFKQALEVWRRRAGEREKEKKKEEDEVKKEHSESVEKVLKKRVNVIAPELIKNSDNDGGTTGSDDDRGKTANNKNSLFLFFNSSLNSNSILSTDPVSTRDGQILKHDTQPDQQPDLENNTQGSD